MRSDDIITRIIGLQEGEMIRVPCETYENMERVRVALYRARNKLKPAMPALAGIIKIRREKDTFSIILSQEADIPTIEIIKPDGTTQVIRDNLAQEKENQRIAELMKADGASEDDIAAYFTD